MKKETRTVVYDDELRLEACRFEGIVQPFPTMPVYRVPAGDRKGENTISQR